MLIDTNVLLWYALDSARLSKRAADVIHKGGNFYSYVSVWELAIKSSMGKLKLTDHQSQPIAAGQFMLNVVRGLNLRSVPIDFGDVAGVQYLPFRHRDPFDRLLAVQAKRHELAIVSADPVFERYDVKRVW